MSLVTKKAPDFTIEAVVGDGDFKKISLSDFRGKYVVLFFYPADFTFICPTEIQEFSRRYEELRPQLRSAGRVDRFEALAQGLDQEWPREAESPSACGLQQDDFQRLRGVDRGRRGLPRHGHH